MRSRAVLPRRLSAHWSSPRSVSWPSITTAVARVRPDSWRAYVPPRRNGTRISPPACASTSATRRPDERSMASSSAQNWSTPETAATGNLVFPPNEFLNGNVRAATLPMARYNWVADRLSVVWHERETSSTTSTTDVFFTARTASGWLAKKRLNSVQTHDQFMPSIDFDSDGNHMTFFYDRSGHSLNELYQPDWVRSSWTGNRIESGTVYSSYSDPDLYGNRFVGDYQDIWWWPFNDTWGDRFNGAWVKQVPVPGPGDQGDIVVTGIQ